MMDVACQISFVGMDAVEAARVEVRAWFLRLGALTKPVTGGHVLIEGVDAHRKLREYRVRMDLTMPDGVVVAVSHDHPSNAAHEDLYVAIRNGFRAARRQLEEYFKSLPPGEGLVATATVDNQAVN